MKSDLIFKNNNKGTTGTRNETTEFKSTDPVYYFLCELCGKLFLISFEIHK